MRLLLILLLAGCGAESSLEDSAAPGQIGSPVVVIGVDGLDPVVLGELLDAGRLPNFARIVEAGVLARLKTMSPTYSPVLWTTIATGQPMAAHGITHFHDEEERPFTSNARRVPALWNIASEYDKRVDCVGWWVTWPAEAINGNMVASYAAQAQANVVWKAGTWENLERQTYPESLRERIKPLMIFASDADEIRTRLWERFPQPRALDDVTKKSVTDLGWTYAADLSNAAIACELLRSAPADLTLVYLALPDVAGHRFWSAHQPDDFSQPLPAQKREDFGEYLRIAYEETDRLVGEIVAAAPSAANILIVSDHGMHAFEEALDDPERGVTGHHEDAAEGIVAALGPQIRSVGNVLDKPRRGLMGEILDVAPLVLHLLDTPVPAHWPKVQRGVALSRMLDEEWRAAHPIDAQPYDEANFRAATEPILPGPGLDQEFMESFKALGYSLGSEDE